MYEVRWGLLDFTGNKQGFFYSPFLKRQHHKCSYVLTALRTSRSDSHESRRPWRDIHLVCFSPACVQYPNIIELWGLAKGSRRICQHSKKEELKNVFFSKLKGKSLKEQNLCWHEVLYPQTLNSSLKRISSIKMPKGQGRNAITPINNSMYVCHTQESWNKTWVELVGTMDRSQQASEERQNGHGQIASKAGDKEQTARRTNEEKDELRRPCRDECCCSTWTKQSSDKRK